MVKPASTLYHKWQCGHVSQDATSLTIVGLKVSAFIKHAPRFTPVVKIRYGYDITEPSYYKPT